MAGFVAENVLKGLWKPFFPTDVANIPEGAYKLDVRNPEELAENGEIPGFVNIPLNQLRGRLSEVEMDKPVYITCAAGLRGYVASRMLEQHGAKEVYNLSGGYTVYSQYIKDMAGLADDNKADCASCGMQIKK